MSATSQELLYAAFRDRPHCDVLIDRMAGFALQEEALAQGLAHEPLIDEMFTHMPEQSPFLLRLMHKDYGWLDTLLDVAREEATDASRTTRSVCAFLHGDADLVQFAKRLSVQLDANVQQFGRVYFRYYDPRVAVHLPRILDDKQYTAWQAGIHAWYYVDWRGGLQWLPEISHADGATVRPFFSPRLTLAQWEEMERIETFNLVLRQLQGIELPMTDDLPERIRKAILAAAAVGLTEPADQATYAAYAIALGPVFIQHPDYTATLALAVNKGVVLHDAIEQRMGLRLSDATSQATQTN